MYIFFIKVKEQRKKGNKREDVFILLLHVILIWGQLNGCLTPFLKPPFMLPEIQSAIILFFH